MWSSSQLCGYICDHHHKIADFQIRDALTRACIIIAGEVAEAILDPEGHRKGSSIDEVALSQRIALGYAEVLKIELKGLWQAVRSRAAHIICHNKTLAQELIARLGRTQSLRNRALHDVLCQAGPGWPR
jgi:hypothetical protein